MIRSGELGAGTVSNCQIESEKCSRGRGRAAFDILKVSMKFCGNFQNIKIGYVSGCMKRHSLMLGFAYKPSSVGAIIFENLFVP